VVVSLNASLSTVDGGGGDLNATVSIFVLPGVYQGEGNQNLILISNDIFVPINSNSSNTSVSVSISFVALDAAYGATNITVCTSYSSSSSSSSSWFLRFDLGNNDSSSPSLPIECELSGFTINDAVFCSSTGSTSLKTEETPFVTTESKRARLEEQIKKFDARLSLLIDYDDDDKRVSSERRYKRLKAGLRSLIDRRSLVNSLEVMEGTTTSPTAFVMIVASSNATTTSPSSILQYGFTITNCSFEGDSTAVSLVREPSNNRSSAIINVVIENSVFQSLTAGAVYVDGGGDGGVFVQITECLFVNNLCDGNTSVGGALVVRNSAVVSVTSSSFVDNFAILAGGAIYASSNVSIWIKSSLFDGNMVLPIAEIPAMGGAVFVTSSGANSSLSSSSSSPSVVTIRDSVFKENIAAVAGGAIASDGARLNVSECLFEANQVRLLL